MLEYFVDGRGRLSCLNVEAAISPHLEYLSFIDGLFGQFLLACIVPHVPVLQIN